MPKNLQIQQSLLTAIRLNEEAVLKKLYVRNYQKVEAYILKNNGNRSQAKDIFQEAFVAMWRNVKEQKFSPENSTALDGYLYSIAKNKWIDFLRSSQYKKTMPIKVEMAQYEASDEQKITDEKLEDERKYDRIAEAYKKLNARCQKMLKQFYFEGKSLAEIAAGFEMKDASARNAKYRCMEKLRKMVHEQ